MLFLAAFWIIVYCNHPNRCDVVKADDGVAVQQYGSKDACHADGPRMIRKDSRCLQVNSVSCYKGGSACTFDPADDESWRMVKKMVPLPD